MKPIVILPLALPKSPAKVHFVGIGGIGMSGLARILHAWGYEVSGSDSTASEQTDLLQSEGIPVNIGHTDVDRAASADLVVMTAAVKPDNLEIDAARAAYIPVVKRAELLGLLANARLCVAIAGSHGKSTTSGMIVSALTSLGADPSYAVGAIVTATGTNAASGFGAAMVVEADEYDYSFLQLSPDIAIVTNIDYDHPDLFPDQTSYDSAFSQFLARVRPGGTVIVAGDDPGVARLLASQSTPPDARIVTFGECEGVNWRLARSEMNWSVRSPDSGDVCLNLRVPGRHNARNATAAMIAILEMGYPALEAAGALAEYSGVGRRFDLKGSSANIVVVDDYAHHPVEIRATIQAAREHYPERRIVVAFQPHTYSRTKSLLEDFAFAFAGADEVIILDIYASRETETLGVSAADLIAKIPGGAIAGGSVSEAVALLMGLAKPGDLILTIGAGDVTGVGSKLLVRLRDVHGDL